MAWKPIDMTGKRYGKLVVIRREGFFHKKDGSKRATWICRCDCGNEKVLLGVDLRNSTHGTKSCGCLVRKEKGASAFRKLVHRLKKQAQERNYAWNLSNENVKEITSNNCFYCGKEPRQVSGEYTNAFNGVYLYNGIDRVDNSRGYDVDNCVPCCSVCNHAKSNSSLDDFKVWINRVHFHWANSS